MELTKNWVILAFVVAGVAAALALIVVGFCPPHRLRAFFATILSALAGAVLAATTVVVHPRLYDLLTQTDEVDPRSQVDVALLPVDNGAILARRLVDGTERLESVSAEGDEASVVTGSETLLDAAWSPDGKLVAYARTDEGSTRLFTASLAAIGDSQPLTTGRVRDREPVWSPSGGQIAFTRRVDGNRDVYVVDADGTNLRQLTTGPMDDSAPTWSPDGSEIAFARQTDAESDIYVLNLRSELASPMLNRQGPELDPAWSPDGSEIAFAWKRDRDFDIYRYIVGYDGASKTVPRTHNDVDDRFPVWSPDGGEIAYVQASDDDVSLRVMNRRTKSEDSDVVGGVLRGRVSWQPLPRDGLNLPRSRGELRLRYAPIAYLHPRDAYRARSASAFIERSRLLCGSRTVDDPAQEPLLGRPPVADPGREPLSPADQRRLQCEGTLRLDLDDGARRGRRAPLGEGLYLGVPAYSERNDRPDGLAMTYWLFYPYSVAAGRFGPHEADWERVTICFARVGRSGAYEPVSIVYHQHNLTERRPWRWAPRLGTHPVVYVAKGSHATYASAGRRVNTQDGTDEGPVWPTWRTLEPVRAAPWYGYRGSWGGPKGPSRAKGGGRECLAR